MKVAIAGAGAVGRSIARELLRSGHTVMLLERQLDHIDRDSVRDAVWVHADACELQLLEDAGLQDYEVVIAATGDDKANLVHSLLAKTEFGVRRVVARVNDPRNEWLFDEAWGVDVAVSTPRLLASLVEEAVTVGDLVRLMTLRQGQANLVELTLPPDTTLAGKPVRSLRLPRDSALVTILRGGRVIVPQPDDPFEGDDELLFVASAEAEEELRSVLAPIGTAETPAGAAELTPSQDAEY
ncbi:potassium channel family protein [Nocardia flavorosea]|uniref:TrkA family potassium uptake protein n=1 Tax=Nocardia flavorosea TaxID=53429 RepID=A0A846YLQ1_9NOCA|nr:TrkA family potassium uptake protein [Nocardia flavorosea]NKY59763.1 TrkA family potassium uptake protein [Nocardia flavorosea]